MKSTSSKEARKYGVQNSCIIVDGVIRLSGAFSEKELEDAIAERTTDGA